MKTKLLLLAALPLLFLQSGCENSGNDHGPQTAIHGDAGVGVESRSTTRIAPTRPAY